MATTGVVSQLYPTYATTGTDPSSAAPSDLVRQPCEGQLISLQVATNGTDAGTLELYDISGHELGINVSSDTEITDTQLDNAITAGDAKLILKQNFSGNGLTPWTPVGPASFMKGLAARVVGVSGTCSLNLVVHGGYRYLNGTV